MNIEQLVEALSMAGLFLLAGLTLFIAGFLSVFVRQIGLYRQAIDRFVCSPGYVEHIASAISTEYGMWLKPETAQTRLGDEIEAEDFCSHKFLTQLAFETPKLGVRIAIKGGRGAVLLIHGRRSERFAHEVARILVSEHHITAVVRSERDVSKERDFTSLSA